MGILLPSQTKWKASIVDSRTNISTGQKFAIVEVQPAPQTTPSSSNQYTNNDTNNKILIMSFVVRDDGIFNGLYNDD